MITFKHLVDEEKYTCLSRNVISFSQSLRSLDGNIRLTVSCRFRGQ